MSAEQKPSEPSPVGEPQPEVPAPAAGEVPAADGITWDKDVKDYFTDADVECMKEKRNFDLSEKEDVKKNAKKIYEVTKSGRMPADRTRTWSAERVANFKAWMDAGFP
ncbi:hypothetical protein QBC47DRAFT_401670 [Echria macrotheca]|uniref:Uncharacterized protein n=1 Tax=Echria macrotheca TaxID=438768 RepID=A0AAJ0BCU3_9PEZI|nr:hypothetical protein QBC47DRAFT_401670 [Echria macrotheca]